MTARKIGVVPNVEDADITKNKLGNGVFDT